MRKPPSEHKVSRARATKNDGELGAVRSEKAKKQKLGGAVPLTDEQKRQKTENQKKYHLKPSEKIELKALWESGEFSLKELAERFNRHPDALSRFFSMEGVIKGAKAEEIAKQIEARIFEELLGNASENAKRIRALKDDYLTRIDTIKKLAFHEIASTKSKGVALQAALPNLRTLKQLQDILTGCRAEEYDLLGVKAFEERIEQDDIPELLVTELTAAEIEDMRRSQSQIAGLDENDVEMELDDEEIGIIDES